MENWMLLMVHLYFKVRHSGHLVINHYLITFGTVVELEKFSDSIKFDCVICDLSVDHEGGRRHYGRNKLISHTVVESRAPPKANIGAYAAGLDLLDIPRT